MKKKEKINIKKKERKTCHNVGLVMLVHAWGSS